jgi:hypothetical protein
LKINHVSFYKTVYGLLDAVTPLKYDCGRLCDSVCCKKTNAGEGMYLYPYEEIMFKNLPSWAKISESDFFAGNKPTPFFSCDGICERSRRPLACRVFPLLPYIGQDGKIYTILDPRSTAICPLSEKGISVKFKKTVHTVSIMLYKVADTRPFLKKQSLLIDDYIKLNNLFSKSNK